MSAQAPLMVGEVLFDAFAARLIQGLLLNEPFAESLEHAQRFASRIIETHGANPMEKNFNSNSETGSVADAK